MEALIWTIVLLLVQGLSDAARVLMVVPTPTKSHHNLMDKLSIDLANRGHHVTLMTAFPQPQPVKNLEEIIFPNYYNSLMESFRGKSEGKGNALDMDLHAIVSLFALTVMGTEMTDTFLSSPVIKKFIAENRKYDVVIGEAFMIEAILAGFSKKYDAPLITISPGLPSFFVNYMVSNPAPSSYVPSTMLGYSVDMNLMERLMNFVYETIASIFFQTYYLSKQDALMRKHFPGDQPEISRIMANTSLILVNHHHALAFPRPYLPNMIEIGGYFVKPVKPLPQDLKKYMDEAKHGVILFSMGSHLKCSEIPEKTLATFTAVFAKLKQNVLWKFDESLPNIPSNVKIMKWIPQSDVLGHPNLKLFITHGGLLSTTEAAIRGVPLLGLPVFGDQYSNMKFVENAGFGKMLSIRNLSEEDFYKTINELLNNKKYSANAKERSILLRDTPLSATDTAIFWIEYVIRHKGAPHLRSKAADLPWYQLYLVDVIAVIATVVILILCTFYYMTKAICSMFCQKKEKLPKLAKKKKQ